MGKGSDHSIHSDPIGFFHHKPLVLNSFQEDHFINNGHDPNRRKRLHPSMDTSIQTTSPPTTFRFPLNLNSSHDDHHSSPPPSDYENRTVIDEMDFFADDQKRHVKASFKRRDRELNSPSDIQYKVNVSHPFSHIIGTFDYLFYVCS